MKKVYAVYNQRGLSYEQCLNDLINYGEIVYITKRISEKNRIKLLKILKERGYKLIKVMDEEYHNNFIFNGIIFARSYIKLGDFGKDWILKG